VVYREGPQVGGKGRETARRPFRRAVLIISTIGLLLTGMAMASAALSSDFADEVVITGLNQPTNLEFAPDGRLFVTEKSGLIKVFDSADDTSATVFADLRSRVHDYWDRGMLGLAVHPDFPSTPYVYVLYTYGVPLGGATPTWGDGCPTPPGGTNDGCVVSGRLSRLQASGGQMTGDEVVLIEDWCQQYPSHSIGDLAFGPDGALYVSAGDGASFNWTDYGQGGGSAGSPTPVNPCQDPHREGGALRSQDIRTGGDPVTLDGTILRVDALTGNALADNPMFGAADAQQKKIVAYGLRNPYRMAIDPSSGAVYAGDVGWNTWEEVNRVANPTAGVTNFGWPCYEGGSGSSLRQGGYDSADLAICETLYTTTPAAVTAPLFAYHHDRDITASDECPPANPPQGTSSSISGLAFYEGGDYPGAFNGALFGSDYSRNCIWVMYRNGAGALDPGTVEIFQPAAAGPVDLEIGPNGDLFYANINQGQVRRIRFVGDNTPPVAAIAADVISGSAPLVVNFDGSGSTDPDLDAIVGFAWDLDGDGQYDDATGPQVTEVFEQPGSYTVRLRVTDARGETGTATRSIQASNSPPVATIDTPDGAAEWMVGETISFSGRGQDPDEGALEPGSLSWEMIMHHCEMDGSCHQHVVQTFDGVANGSFVAPDHEYPSWLELRLTVTDQFGVQDADSVELDPKVVDLTFASDPGGLQVSFAGEPGTAPFARTVIVGATVEISTEANQSGWQFESWSNGGSRVQAFAAPASDTTYTANFDRAPLILTGPELDHDENTVVVVDIESSDNADSEGSGLSYELTGGADRNRFVIDSTTGVLRFSSPPDFESPGDSNRDNRYRVDVSVRDSSGLSGSQSFTVTVLDVEDQPADPGGPGTARAPRIVSSGGGAVGSHAVNEGTRAVVDVDAVDSDGDSEGDGLTYVVVGGLDADLFEIGSRGVLRFRFAPDYERPRDVDLDNVYVVTVRVIDSDGLYDSQQIRVTVRDLAEAFEGSFRDDDRSQFESAIEWMAGEGITAGCNPPANDRFCPDQFVTRAQMAAFFSRAFGWSDVGGGDLFVDDDGLVFEREIDLMATAGVTRGCNPPTNDRFCPDQFVTRAQMAAFFQRAFN